MRPKSASENSAEGVLSFSIALNIFLSDAGEKKTMSCDKCKHNYQCGQCPLSGDGEVFGA